MWKDICEFKYFPCSERSLVRGTLVAVDPSICTVQLLYEDLVITATVPNGGEWLFCLAHIVQANARTALRVEVQIANVTRVTERFFVCIDAPVFDALMVDESFSWEASFVSLVSQVWTELQIVREPEGDHGGEEMPCSSLWNPQYELFPHQARSVVWMLDVEEGGSCGRIEYTHGLPITDTWRVNVKEEAFTSMRQTGHARLKGGICCDGAGTGKTATALRFAIQRSLSKTLRSDNRYVSNATLIIVPLNLVAQWKGEVDKFLSPSARVLWFIQGRDIKAQSLDDVCGADVVVTTFHFLRASKPYNEMVDEEIGPFRRRAGLRAWARRRGHSRPVLHAVRWRSVIVDEMHATLDTPRDLKELSFFQCETLWGLTATPRLQGDATKHLYTMIQSVHPFGYQPLGRDEPDLLAQAVAKGVRGTPSTLARPSPELRCVKLSTEERSEFEDKMSEVHTTEDVVKLATQIDATYIDVTGDTQTVKQRLISAMEKETSILSARAEGQERTVRILRRASVELEKELRDLEHRCCEGDELALSQAEGSREAAASHARDLSRAEESLASARAALDRRRAAINLVTDKLCSVVKETCSICMDTTCSVITPCAHMFCARCAHRQLQEVSHTCPTCRAPLDQTDLIGIFGGFLGMKMRTIASLIESLKGECIVLFVQWKSMMRGMRAFLKGMGVRAFVLDGNTQQRSGKLQQFARGGVLILCMEDSFAGLHLVHARHVIFAHAIVGDRDTVEALEAQAVARSVRHGQTRDVNVYSFVIADCEEECLWRQTH